MALTQCAECGREISDRASNCPGCGARRRPRTKTSTWIIGGIFGAGCLYAILHTDPLPEPRRQESLTLSTPIESPPTEQLTDAKAAASLIRASAKNPRSVEFSSVLAIPASGKTCFVYRAQNGFGGPSVGYAISDARHRSLVTNESTDAFKPLWVASCEHKSGIDITGTISGGP